MTESESKAPSLSQNFVSLFGLTIIFASVAGIIFSFLIELLGSRGNPYLGIFIYIVFPGFLSLGLIAFFGGRLLERRRRLKPGIVGYPILDLNNPRRRRQFLTFSAATLLFLFVSAFGSYRAYEYTESVVFCGQLCHIPMKPEFMAYQQSPHSRVACVDCHVGKGAGWYVKSKLSGAYQVYAAAFDKFPRPIPTPVANLRPAQDTCEQCHWPAKFFGAQLKVFNHYGFDEDNTLRQTRMLINTGGGSPEKGVVAGIHWHMNISNEITYVATDDQRQVIPWVRLKDRSTGEAVEFLARDSQLTGAQIEQATKRTMDCVECHNRPSHIYVPPDRSVNEAMVARKIDAALPYIKQKSVEVLTRRYASTDEATKSIASILDEYYRTTYPSVYSTKADSVKAAISEVQRIFTTSVFPEMKVDWQTHPDNVGHYYNLGCFRCHDGEHVSAAGKVIRNDCNICHTTLDQTDGTTTIAAKGGAFTHPLELDVSTTKCTECHSGKGLKD
jgi:nitrate/TMAO reductase-like tetraheme cytochrome c subunit